MKPDNREIGITLRYQDLEDIHDFLVFIGTEDYKDLGKTET